jgi:hypothetical protein
MAEILGPNDISMRALPTGVDATRVAQWMIREGFTFQEMVNALALALGDFNQDIMNKWGWLFSITQDLMMEYPDGSSVTELKEITDYDKVDLVSGQTIGHMIDLAVYGGGIGGTKRWFRDARMAQWVSQIRTIVNQARWRFEKALVTRAMTNTENAVGSGGYDVPFVRGTGGNVDFTPPAYAGTTFASSHDHFIGVNVSTPKTFADVLNLLAATLEEHGHKAPFTAMISRTDVTTIMALTNIIKFVAPVVQRWEPGGATSGAQFVTSGQPDVSDGLTGYFQSEYGQIDLMANPRIPTGYVGMYKSYGKNDARNPLAVRVHPQSGFGAYVVTETTDDRQYPIKSVRIEMEFGVGTGMDRTNGAVGYLVAGGSYANPTIS